MGYANSVARIPDNMTWFQTDNLTPELEAQKQRDYRLMFYGSEQNKAILAELCLISDTCDIESRNILRDFIRKIKVNCGLDDYREIINAESEALTRKESIK